MPAIYVLSKNMKIIKNAQRKIIVFTVVKNCSILLWRVFVMHIIIWTPLKFSSFLICLLAFVFYGIGYLCGRSKRSVYGARIVMLLSDSIIGKCS